MTQIRPQSITLAECLAPDANSFGPLRLMMAAAVLISHSFFFVTGTTAAEPLYSLTGHSLGEHAVQVFFFMSGILVTQSYARSGSLIDFAVARGLRIFPGLIVCVLLTALVLGPLVSAFPPARYWADPVLPSYLTRTLLLITGSAPLPGVFTGLPASGLVNMSLWTLKYEVLCYAILALICATGLLTGKYKAPATAALALGVALVFIGTPKPIETYSAFDNLRYFALYFGMGVLAYQLRERLVIRASILAALFAVFALAIGSRFGELTGALFIGYLAIYASSFHRGRVAHSDPAALTAAAKAGRDAQPADVSFGLYIYASPVQQTLLEAFPYLDAVSLAAATLALTSGLALASWIAIEKPAMAQRRAIVGWLRRPQRAPQPQAARPLPAGLDRILALKRSAPAHA